VGRRRMHRSIGDPTRNRKRRRYSYFQCLNK
jgi:hypothetical protein